MKTIGFLFACYLLGVFLLRIIDEVFYRFIIYKCTLEYYLPVICQEKKNCVESEHNFWICEKIASFLFDVYLLIMSKGLWDNPKNQQL